jgi:hypothetical protein
MDESGITVQVLSASGPGADLVDGAERVSLARDMNDVLARLGVPIYLHPNAVACDRSAGIARAHSRCLAYDGAAFSNAAKREARSAT